MSNSNLDLVKSVLKKYLPLEADQEKFLNEKTSAFGGQSPKEFLQKSRRGDKLAFTLDTIKQLFENTYEVSSTIKFPKTPSWYQKVAAQEAEAEKENLLNQALNESPDCGDNSCRYAVTKGGMRTNGGCRCMRNHPEKVARFAALAVMALSKIKGANHGKS